MVKIEDRIQKMREKQKHLVKTNEAEITHPTPLLAPMPVLTQPVRKERPNWRLPDGSTFAATYDAEKVQWTGHLIIPGLEAFRTEHNTLFGLFQKLDRKYRKVLRQERKENP